jgi:hypothetical protein
MAARYRRPTLAQAVALTGARLRLARPALDADAVSYPAAGALFGNSVRGGRQPPDLPAA